MTQWNLQITANGIQLFDEALACVETCLLYGQLVDIASHLRDGDIITVMRPHPVQSLGKG